MAHYAFLDENNIVVEVIVGADEENVPKGITSWEDHYESFRNNLRCIRTSYNSKIRKNFAQIGFTYDENRDAFIPPKPFPSWTLDDDTCLWNPPIPYPSDGNLYVWDEKNKSWSAI